jgi:hypothetical protein
MPPFLYPWLGDGLCSPAVSVPLLFPCSDFFVLLLRSLEIGRAVLDKGPQEAGRQFYAMELMDRSAVRLPNPPRGFACA